MKLRAALPDLWVVEPPFLAFHVFPLKDAARSVCGRVEPHWPQLVPIRERGGLEGWREQFTHCHSCERVLRARGYLGGRP